MTAAPRFATYFHVHLVSDSTGETLNAMARAVCARFDERAADRAHLCPGPLASGSSSGCWSEIEDAPGVVIHTIVDDELRAALEEGCRELDMPCIAGAGPAGRRPWRAISGASLIDPGRAPSTRWTPTISTAWTR